MGTVLSFPKRAIERAAPAPSPIVATWFWHAKAGLDRMLRRLGFRVPPSHIEVDDSRTGKKIVIDTGPVFTRLTVNGTDYFYDRNGRLHGSGSQVHYLPAKPRSTPIRG
jgi:hypothetical protein